MEEKTRTLVLGHAREREACEEEFLGGRLRVVSHNGLRASERAILPLLPQGRSGRALVFDSVGAVLGYALRALNPEMQVCCYYEDAWHAERATEMLAVVPEPGIEVSLAPDPPEGPFDIVVLPLERYGLADQVRERVRLAVSHWLRPGGLLYSSSDWAGEHFVREEIRKAFGALHIAVETGASRHGAGVGYVARRPAQPRIAPPRTTERFEVQEEGQTLSFTSRLGVFCSGRLDPGSRALLALADLEGARRILDLGCGCGVVGIIAALRAPQAQVGFLDSNARAVEAARLNIETHGLGSRCKVWLSADPLKTLSEEPPFDCVLTNPPYYGNWRIAELFLETSKRVLRRGGRLILVTKGPEWYRSKLPEAFSSISEQKRGGYTVFNARRR